jgi:hypothetical protein
MPVMTDTNDGFFDVWRKVPPEEKLELMARAQSKGVGATLVLLIITGTMALGLRLPWLFWSTFLAVPFVFQFAAAKAWRDLKPRAMLDYLAARSAARRYAYGAHAQDLTVSLMFRGVLRPEFGAEQEQEQMEAQIQNKAEVPVWVALFPDTIVMMSERAGGAKLEFAQSISEKLTITTRGFDNDGEQRQVILTSQGRKGNKLNWNLTSQYPAALLVFERKAKGFTEAMRLQVERDTQAYRELYSGPSASLLDEDDHNDQQDLNL